MTEPALGLGEALAYGVIQGATEFLPISSSGHLRIAHLLGLGELPAALETPFDVLLHGASLLAIIVAFRREILLALGQPPRFWLSCALAVVPAGLVGLLLGDIVTWYGQAWWRVGLAYLGCAGLLVFAHLRRQREVDPAPVTGADLRAITPGQGLTVGLFQVSGLLPGISRSGSTLVGGLTAGLRPVLAVAFAFLVGLPLIAAAAAKDALDGGLGELRATTGDGPLAIAILACFVVSLVSIALLKLVVRRQSLHWFALYCALIGGFCLVMEVSG